MGFFSNNRTTRREERFGRGDIKYMILDLLRERPSYGYEIIHAMEGRFGGLYTPSPGTIYPTLQMLEDMDYVTVAQTEGRKTYTITEAGLKFLDESKNQVAGVRERMSGWWDEDSSSQEMHDAIDSLKDLRRLLKQYRRGITADKVTRIREVINRTRAEIEMILKD